MLLFCHLRQQFFTVSFNQPCYFANILFLRALDDISIRSKSDMTMMKFPDVPYSSKGRGGGGGGISKGSSINYVIADRGEGSPQKITVLHRGGSGQMITVLHRGGLAK